MMKQEKDLRKKLDLSIKEELKIRNFPRVTRNKNYVLEIDGIPTYFMKINSEGNIKERRMYDFLENNPVLNTPLPVYRDDEMIILPFISDFRDSEIKNSLEIIIDFHNKALKIPKKEFEICNQDSALDNHYIKKFLNRVGRHEELVKNFWNDFPALHKFYKNNPSEKFESLPKIFVHGDISHKNMQDDSSGKKYILDFEDVYYEEPSWDLTRPVMDLEKQDIEDYIEKYLEGIDIKNKRLLKESFNKNLITRLITDSIGAQQRFGKEKANIYLSRYLEKFSDKLQEIIYDKN